VWKFRQLGHASWVLNHVAPVDVSITFSGTGKSTKAQTVWFNETSQIEAVEYRLLIKNSNRLQTEAERGAFGVKAFIDPISKRPIAIESDGETILVEPIPFFPF
jgi:hypothetical protein